MARRGYIHDKLDIKILELYLLTKAAGPIDPNTLADLMMSHKGVEYFDFVDATSELLKSGHLVLQETGYSITEKGRANSAATESGLPYSVRRKCGRELAPVNAALRRNAQVQTEIVKTASGEIYAVLTLDDDGGNLFTLRLLCPSETQAERVIYRFKEHPEQVYNDVLEALSEPSVAAEFAPEDMESENAGKETGYVGP